jgi:hypothetical protein
MVKLSILEFALIILVNQGLNVVVENVLWI